MHAAFLQTREINHAVRKTLAEIHVLDEHALRGVVVTVHAQNVGLDAVCFVGLLAQ